MQHPAKSLAGKCVLVLALCCLTNFDGAAAADDSLKDLLERGVQLQLEGNYEQAMRLAKVMKKMSPDSAISGAFEMNGLVTQLSWDTTDTRFDKALEAEARAVLSLCKQHTKAMPDEAAGYFLCGQAHFALTFLYAARGSYYRAGRNSSHTITQLEAAITRDASLTDAKIYLGATYYYADNLPPFVKAVSRFLWFIPTGNSARALPYMKDAAENGEYLRGAAKFIYADLVMSSEPSLIDEAGGYLKDLIAAYPANPRFRLKYMQYLAQIGQFDQLLSVAEDSFADDVCCTAVPEYAGLIGLWKVRAHLELKDTTAAQLQFAAVDRTDFPSWGDDWYEEIKQKLPQPQ